MITLHLHGSIAEKYGAQFTMAASSPAEIVHSLAVQLPGFQRDIEDGAWHVVRGEPEDGDDCSYDKLRLQMRHGEEVHLMPALSGAGNGGLFTVVLGVALIAAGMMTGGTSTALGMSLLAGGAGMVVGGIVQMTMKMPGVSSSSSESADDRASFLFNGPRNQSTQGVAIPRGYGRCRVGSVVISVGLDAEDVAV